MKKTIAVLLCMLAFGYGWSQTRQLSGVVVDALSNQGVVSATVKVKGSPAATATDADGRFALNVPAGRVTLEVSSVGFRTREVVVGAADNNITISLAEDASELGEVVVTALGIKKDRRKVGYAVGEVKGDDLIKAREINLGNALAGRVAGVNASPTATGPAGSSRVVIRGATSASTNNQPLYVINGIPMDNTQLGSAGMWGGVDRGDGLSSLNPDDIESISVLKGSAASALYGARGAFGVVLITTKSGKGQKGLGIEFNSTYTLDRPVRLTDWQYEYGSGTWNPNLNRFVRPTTLDEARNYAFLSWGERMDGAPVPGLDGKTYPYSPQRDNMKHFYNNGSTFSNTVSVSGGKEGYNFRFSAGRTDNQAMVRNSGFDRNNLTFSVGARPNKRIEFDGNIQYIMEKSKNRTFLSDAPKNPNYSVQALATSIDVRTLDPGYDSNGRESPHFGSNVFTQTPYFAVNKVSNTDNRNRFIGQAMLKYNLGEGLYARARLATDYFVTNVQEIEPTGIAYRPLGAMSESQSTFQETNLEFIMGYDKEFGDFSVNAFVGANRQMNKYQQYGISGSDFNIPFFYSVTNLRNRGFSNGFSETRVNSVFSSVDLGYKNYLFLTLTGRQDWFSTLSPQNNKIFYPSASLGFVFSDAFQMPSWINFGKVRASWANVGGATPSAYQLVQTYSLVAQGFQNQPMMATSGSTLRNPNLKPLNVNTIEFGIDGRLFNNRMGFDVAYYDKRTTDDIAQVGISQTSGYNDVLVNVGQINNRGIELLLSYDLIKRRDFRWEVSYNFAHNINKLVKLADGLSTRELDRNRDQNAFVFLEEGQPFGVIKSFTFLRNDKGDILYDPAGFPLRGGIETVGFGVHPTQMGFINNFSYKAFFLNVLIDGKFGGDIHSGTNYIGYRLGLHKETLQGREGGIQVNGVTPQGAPVNRTVDAFTYWRNWALNGPDNFVFDASFVKLRSLTVGFNLPDALMRKTPFAGASISLVGRNLALLYSKVPNVDPESNYTATNAQGLERFGVPIPRSFGANLNLKF